MPRDHSKALSTAWTLNQVQGDEFGAKALRVFARTKSSFPRAKTRRYEEEKEFAERESVALWFPNKDKLDHALLNLVIRVEIVQDRIQSILDESRIFDSFLGPSVETEEFRERGSVLKSALLNLKTGLSSDRLTAQEINKRLPTATAMVRNHEHICSAMEKARASAALAVDRYFEG